MLLLLRKLTYDGERFARSTLLYPRVQRAPGDLQQPPRGLVPLLGLTAWLQHEVGLAAVPVHAAQVHGHVDVDHVSCLQGPRVRDTVAYHVVHWRRFTVRN